MKPQIPWLRVGVEGVVIVGSILLAFGIQAWWDEVQERGREHDALQRLDAEFVQVDSVLSAYRAHHSGVLQASRILLAHTGPEGSPGLSPDSIAVLVATITWTWSLDPPSATQVSLESSGHLGAIRNQGLLTALAAWRALMVDLQGDERQVNAVVDDRLMPFLNSRIALKTLSHFDRGLLAEEPGPPSSFESGFSELLGSLDFENFLDQRRAGTFNVVNDYDVVQASLAALRALIQRELVP